MPETLWLIAVAGGPVLLIGILLFVTLRRNRRSRAQMERENTGPHRS